LSSRAVRLLENTGVVVSGKDKNNLPVVYELKSHPFYILVKFHPEYRSRPGLPHPLFISFLQTVDKYKTSNKIVSHE